MDNNLNDPKNIAGLSNLLRDDDVDSTMDLAELEREIASGAVLETSTEVNVADEYRKEMERMSRNFDIGMTITEPDLISDQIDTEFDQSPTHSVRSIRQSPISHALPETLSRNHYNSPRLGQSHSQDYDRDGADHIHGDSQLRNMTQEERKQDRINQVLHDIDDRELEFNIEKEKDEDDKSSLLEQIDMLKITLEDDGVDVSGVPQINKNSSMNDVHNVYKILRLKNDRNRYCSFAEELILSGAYGMEYLFDGKKEWFAKRPDLTGWSSTVKVKLRRMRFETSTFVQEVMQEYNMSAGMRLALELLPSMFLYSRNRRLSQDDNLVSDAEYKNAISKLNSM
jgi:hypothetical protein